MRSSSAQRQQHLTRFLCSLAPSQGIISVSWCQADGYTKVEISLNRMDSEECKGRCLLQERAYSLAVLWLLTKLAGFVTLMTRDRMVTHGPLRYWLSWN